MNATIINVDDRFISVAGTCNLLDISRATFYNMLRDGRLRAYKIGTTIRVRMSDIESALSPYGSPGGDHAAG
jgi:excisionase family DNA binding protein